MGLLCTSPHKNCTLFILHIVEIAPQLASLTCNFDSFGVLERTCSIESRKLKHADKKLCQLRLSFFILLLNYNRIKSVPKAHGGCLQQ